MFTIRLLPDNQTYYCDNKQTVLQAALNAGVDFPNRCQVGACATCLCRRVSGEVSYELAPLLTEQEEEQGWIFACIARPESDLVLRWD